MVVEMSRIQKTAAVVTEMNVLRMLQLLHSDPEFVCRSDGALAKDEPEDGGPHAQRSAGPRSPHRFVVERRFTPLSSDFQFAFFHYSCSPPQSHKLHVCCQMESKE